MRVALFSAVILMTALPACSGDPASQEPVQVRPGMYEAKLSAGVGPFSMGNSKMDSRSCVTADEAEHFPQVFTRHYLSMDGSCDGPLSERRGNLVTGKLVCTDVGDDRTVTMNYAATVRQESVDVDIDGEFSSKPKDLEDTSSTKAKLSRAIELKLAIRRVGDC